jgi:hypothetical protein
MVTKIRLRKLGLIRLGYITVISRRVHSQAKVGTRSDYVQFAFRSRSSLVSLD